MVALLSSEGSIAAAGNSRWGAYSAGDDTITFAPGSIVDAPNTLVPKFDRISAPSSGPVGHSYLIEIPSPPAQAGPSNVLSIPSVFPSDER